MIAPPRPDNAAEGLEPEPPLESRLPVALDPELQARLATLETERVRRERWRTRLWRERRVLLLLLGLVLILYANFGVVRVVGRSMEPQFVNGQSLFILKSYRRLSPLRPGDIIVFHNPQEPTQELVKRIVFIQDTKGTRPWPQSVRTSAGVVSLYKEFTEAMRWGGKPVPAQPFPPDDAIYVMGDNVENSTDSRDFGPIRDDAILGKVLVPGLP